jgi:photosystem II stability/assembly factor-like uncharacterized protein
MYTVSVRTLLRALSAALGLAGLLAFTSGPAAEQPRPVREAARADDAPAAGALPSDWVPALSWRCIGPANMGGRIVALSVFEADPSTYWVATASGGLLKTTNNGVSFEHQFDREATVSIGDVCVAPSDRNIVWVGAGENNPRNSVSWGDGVYKSTDGGKTWKNMGLKKSFQIGKILVHPANPDVVYVGALGRLYGASEERGLYKTTNGGKSWERVLYIDDKTGVIDMRMSPADPETLLVAAWERQRDGFDSFMGEPIADGYDGYDPIKKWGKGGGIYRTTDGGKTFKKATDGLPAGATGRIGLDWYRKDPKIVFAIVDCEKIGMGTAPKVVAGASLGLVGFDPEDAKGVRVTEVTPRGPADAAGLKPGDEVLAIDGKAVGNYRELIGDVGAHKPGDKVKVKYLRDNETTEVEVTLSARQGGGGGRFGGGAYLGLQGEDAGDDKGAKLEEVTADGPAARAGLKAGDVIRKVGDKEVKNYEGLLEVARAARPGDKVKVEVVRGKDPMTLELTYGERPGRGAGGPGTRSANRPNGATYAGQAANVQDDQGAGGHEYGGVYKSTDAGLTWTRINSINPRPMYFSQVRVDPSDDKYLYVLGVSLSTSNDGGKTFRTAASRAGIHADQHALWIDPKDGRHQLIGCDGGYYATYDRGVNWDHLNHMAIGQFYHVAVCSKRPYWVYGGLQDNGSWGGPSVGLRGTGPINEDWIPVGGGDGFVCRIDPNDADLVYAESQGGAMLRYNLRTGERSSIRPARPEGGRAHRFNWNTPFILSSHNSHIFYCGGEYVFRSVKQGDDLHVISPEITRTKRGSATALSESPRNPDVLWAGTDDGALWVTRDGGKNWSNVSDKVGLPGPRWVATIEASRFATGRAYVAFDGHRSDDDEPHVYVTEDYGQSWKSLRAELPTGSTRCLREDVEKENVLYLGTEFSVYASIDRGGSWTRINGNLPTVAVHEIAVHPTAGEIVAATHGRSLWVLDVTALRQITPDKIKGKPALYRPNTVTRWPAQPGRGRSGRRYVGDNPRPGAHIYYSLPARAEKASLRIVDIDGAEVNRLTASASAGLHRVAWDLTRAEGRRGVPAGAYRVVLTLDGVEQGQSFRVEGDPAPVVGRRGGEEEDEDDGDDDDD